MDIFKDIADPEVNGKIDGPDLTKLREAYNEFETALAFGMEGLRTMDLYKAVKELLEQEGK